ncbi:MAG: hypothetical protein LBQ19_00340, partial [Synergistaceae bacterium]|nr:hypothetical protein [Synergistaceae bacterium]
MDRIYMPELVRVKRAFKRPRVDDVEKSVADEFARLSLGDALRGAKVGVTVGSRGIRDILAILRTLIRLIKSSGGEPVLLAAMGSHGAGSEEGQSGILTSLGVTEDALGAPIMTCAKSAEIGKTKDGGAAYALESALSVDAIIVVNRVKVHTAFHGAVESGLFKMLAVGLGGPAGAVHFHGAGRESLPDILLDIGSLMLKKLPVAAGFAIVENAFEETALIKGVDASSMEEEERGLLEFSRSLMPSLPASRLDALIVEEMGKNYSGTGLDTNIIGRLRIEGVPEPPSPEIKRVAVLDLSAESHGNANGVGLADLATKKLVDSIDKRATFLNCATTGFFMRGAVPVHFDTEREVVEVMLKSLAPKP